MNANALNDSERLYIISDNKLNFLLTTAFSFATGAYIHMCLYSQVLKN